MSSRRRADVRCTRTCRVQILVAMLLGVLVGYLWPESADALKPLGDLFIRLVRMIVAPIIFCTVVHGIASVGEARRVGRVAIKALIYFEIVTTLRAGAGPRAGEYLGAGRRHERRSAPPWPNSNVADVAAIGEARRLRRVPSQPRADERRRRLRRRRRPAGAVLLRACSPSRCWPLGPKGKPMVDAIHFVSQVLFKMIGFVMYVAPIGAFGAIAFTVGKFGPSSLLALGSLVADVLRLLRAVRPAGAVAHRVGVRRQHAAVDPLYRRGADDRRRAPAPANRCFRACTPSCASSVSIEPVVALVLPAGYAFNHDGTCLYFATRRRSFSRRPSGIDLSIGQQLGLLAIMLVTSKGGAGVAGSAIVVLASTLAATGTIPVASIGLILGVHRLLSSAFVPVNVLGNALATIVIARMERAIDMPTFESELHRAAGADQAVQTWPKPS